MTDTPQRAADSPANSGEQRGTAWPGFPMSDDRMAQIGDRQAPAPTVAAILPDNIRAAQGEAGHGYARPSGPVTVHALPAVEHPGQPDPFPRRTTVPEVQPAPHTAPIHKGAER